jgi:hypothetical protein
VVIGNAAVGVSAMRSDGNLWLPGGSGEKRTHFELCDYVQKRRDDMLSFSTGDSFTIGEGAVALALASKSSRPTRPRIPD